MPNVPGLRSPYIKVGRLVYFGRMLDKIRLHAAGKLPAEYVENYGDEKPTVFDARCCRFLGVSHAEIVAQVLAGKTDEQTLAWCHAKGEGHTDEQCDIWNMFMTKRGWRDTANERLHVRMRESGFEGRDNIQTFFDYIEVDEGRDPEKTRLS
jgi:gluconokinase